MTAKAAKATTEDKNVRKLPTAAPDAQAEANEQADAYESLFSPTPFTLDNGEVLMVPLHPDYAMLDDEKMEQWDELMFAVDTLYERDPDVLVPEQRLKHDNGEETGVILPAETVRGQLRKPFQIRNEDTGKLELVKPPHSIRVVQIALGETEYKRLREAGNSAGDIWKVWGEQSLRIRERQQRDPKSAGSSMDLAPVSETDSQ